MRWLEVTYNDKRRTVLEVGPDTRGAEVGYLCWQLGDKAGWRTMKRNDMLDMRLAPPQWSSLPDTLVVGLGLEGKPVPPEVLEAATRRLDADIRAPLAPAPVAPVAAPAEADWPSRPLLITAAVFVVAPVLVFLWWYFF